MAQNRVTPPEQPVPQSEARVAADESVAPQRALPIETSAAPTPKMEDVKKVVVPQVNQVLTTVGKSATVKGPNARKLVANYDNDAASGSTTRKTPRRAEAVNPPADIIENAEEWKISTNFYNHAANGFIDFGNTIKVAVDGNDIYVQGLCLWLPEAWVHGTINGNVATFTTGQFYGTFTQNGTEYDMYFVGYDTYQENVCDVTFNYSAVAHKLTLQEDLEIYVGSNTTGGYYAYHLNTVIAKEYVTPPVPVEIANGDDANQRIPVYGNRYNYSTTSQMIYPASMLSNFEDGQQIKSVTFYTNNDGIKFSGGQITVTIGTTDQTYFTGNTALTITGTTATATVVPNNNSTTMKVEFSNPLVYTAGSNIIIQMVNSTQGTYAATTTWMGVAYNSGNDTYYSYSSRGSNNNTSPARLRFMPKATFELQYPPMLTDELDFGSVKVGQSKTMKAFVENTASEAVSATVTTSTSFSASSPVVLQPGVNEVSVTFTPTDAVNYNGTMTVHVNGTDIVITLKGTGQEDGPLAIRDKEFFEGITYKWTDEKGNKRRSNLSEVATEPNQIIAMIKEVYTNQSIPGNYKRGCDANGNFTEDWSDVNYPAIGTLSYDGSSTASSYTNPNNYSWVDTYGWGIDTKKPVICNVNTSYSTTYPTYYTHFDQTEYKPFNEGVTLLLIEVADGYDLNTYTFPTSSGLEYLKSVIGTTIKSARVVTQAMRVGEDRKKGTLFNVECDKMNKFFFMAKGQLREPFNSMMAYYGTDNYNSNAVFCPYPMYVYSQHYFYAYHRVNKYVDYLNAVPFYQMFEQFSPVSLETGGNIDDLYSSLCDMASFNVIHDCIAVPFATTKTEGDIHHGHQFMMYGVESGAADCQDVRDMMFFVPDYRMMSWSGRNSTTVPYTNYNQTYSPKMGLYVIRQDVVTGAKLNDELYKLSLTWRSNMDDFLPSDEQYYELWEEVIDEYGVSKYVPVYYRDAQGRYKLKDGTWFSGDTIGHSQDFVPVVLSRNDLNNNTFTEYTDSEGVKWLRYNEVYVDIKASSQTKTYVIRGRDSKKFLSLQTSNKENYFIKGTDPAEVALMSSATIYSRFEAQNVRNCYSNKLKIESAPRSIKASYLPNGSTMSIVRSYVPNNGSTNTSAENVEETVATLTINTATQKFKVTGSVLDTSVEGLFPKGTKDKRTAGYHANELTNNEISYSTSTNSGVQYINFDFTLWDNFVVDVANNDHPGLYSYQLKFTSAEDIEGATGDNPKEAYSNPIRVPVYKTDSKISASITLDDVLGDMNCNPDFAPSDVEFGAQVQLSSKSEILRYDAYRWDDDATTIRSIYEDGGSSDEDEEDVDPTGIAGNQGDYYTVTMNDVNGNYYYVASSNEQPVVNTSKPTDWANFVDYYPTSDDAGAGAYVYAPVVELRTKGYQAGSTTELRNDYNTYGGPLKDAAVGKLDVKVMDPYVDIDANGKIDDHSLMSNYKWYDKKNRNWYSYYNVYLKFTALDVPEGYELYKVRAWRKVDKDILGEELETRKVRIPVDQDGNPKTDWYMYEDMNFGDPLQILPEGSATQPSVMSKSALKQEGFVLGERSAMIAKPVNPDGTGGGRLFEVDTNGNPNVGDGVIQEDGVQNEVRATFGAQRLEIDGDDSGKLKNLNAEFKVRAYFTKSTNPLIVEPITTTVLSPIYVIGNSNMSSSWDPTKALAILYTDDGKNYEGTFTPNDAGDSYGYFSLTNKLSSAPNDWDQIASNRIQPEEAEKVVPADDVQLKYYNNGGNHFKAKAGKTYKLTLTNYVVSTQNGANAGVLTVTELPSSSNAPRRAEADNKTAYDFDYYVAEGTAEFKSEEYDNIITGISGVKADVNREVVSVTYVNPLGQQSSRPFSGVNMVVTRYSDGSATTTKVVK